VRLGSASRAARLALNQLQRVDRSPQIVAAELWIVIVCSGGQRCGQQPVRFGRRVGLNFHEI
jgi:hypothetical protein